MRRLSLLGLILVIYGCTTTSSGVMPYGAGRFTVTSSSEYGLAKAKESVLKQASEYCSGQRQSMQPISQRSGTERGRFASTSTTYDLIFTCE